MGCIEPPFAMAVDAGSGRRNAFSYPGYSSIADANQNLQYCFVGTKKPIWNEEVQQWMHFFGGRVKVPSIQNFIAMQIPAIYDQKQVYYNSAIQDYSPESISIRHGKVRPLLRFHLLSLSILTHLLPFLYDTAG
jgi:hypothetical protein